MSNIQYILTEHTLTVFDTSQIPYVKNTSTIGTGYFSLGRVLVKKKRIEDLAFFTTVGHKIKITPSITIQSTLASSINIFIEEIPLTLLSSFVDESLIESSKILNGDSSSLELTLQRLKNISVKLSDFLLCNRITPLSKTVLKVKGKRFTYTIDTEKDSVHKIGGRHVCLHASYDKEHLYKYDSKEEEKTDSILCKILACLNDDQAPLLTFLRD